MPTSGWSVTVSGLTVSGVPLGIVPLTLTALIVAVVYRYGRWAAEISQEVDDDRTVGVAATIFTGLYMVVAVVTCVVLGQESASPGLGRAIIGSMLVAGVAGTLGLAVGTGRLPVWVAASRPGCARSPTAPRRRSCSCSWPRPSWWR